jgi:hypothetical protein
MKSIAAVTAVALLVATAAPRAQETASPAVWREFAATLQPGAAVVVRTTAGQRVKASLLQVSDEAITIQPKTRVPVPPQQVRYADIESIELQRANGGAGLARAVAIGAAVGAGAFLGLLLIFVAAIED